MPVMLKKLKVLMEDHQTDCAAESNFAETYESTIKRRRISSPSNDCSNSSWAEIEIYMIGSSKIHPLSNGMSQRFIFQYLSSLGEYQELLSFIFEHNVLSMILKTIALNRNNDVRLAFDALKVICMMFNSLYFLTFIFYFQYLASLISHKKFALEFVNSGGVQSLLQVYRPSLAANAVSLCLNCIAYHDDVMEKVCCLFAIFTFY